jgi:hypothetical protein
MQSERKRVGDAVKEASSFFAIQLREPRLAIKIQTPLKTAKMMNQINNRSNNKVLKLG